MIKNIIILFTILIVNNVFVKIYKRIKFLRTLKKLKLALLELSNLENEDPKNLNTKLVSSIKENLDEKL